MGKKLVVTKGDRYGYLTIIKEAKRKNKVKRRFLCHCNYKNCQNEVEVNLNDLRNGDTKSCGCYMITSSKERATKHGLYGCQLYTKWVKIIQKCTNGNNKDYKYYGERGIGVCDEWRNDFLSFYNWSVKNGYEEKLEIDRRDNDGNYEPSNCRFVTHQKNAENKRMIQINNKSGYRGVYLNKMKGMKIDKYSVQVRNKGVIVYNKYGFVSKIAAAIARDTFIINSELDYQLNLTYIEPNISGKNGWVNH